MTPRISQIAQVMQRGPEHALADVGLVRGKVGDPLRESHRDPALRVAEAIIPQAPDRAQAILGVVEPLGNRKNVCPRSTNLGTSSLSDLGAVWPHNVVWLGGWCTRCSGGNEQFSRGGSGDGVSAAALGERVASRAASGAVCGGGGRRFSPRAETGG